MQEQGVARKKAEGDLQEAHTRAVRQDAELARVTDLLSKARLQAQVQYCLFLLLMESC